MLLDLLQGGSTMHPGASHSLSSLPDGLHLTDILSSCSLPDASSPAASLLHLLQEGAVAPANAFLDTNPTSAESQTSLPLSYTHPYYSTLSQHHDEIFKQEHMPSLVHPSDRALLQSRAPPCMHDNGKSSAPRLHLPSDDALEPSTSSATSSEPSSTLVNMDAGKIMAQNQQLCHLNASSRRHIAHAVGFRSEDCAQQSTQTSLDEESSVQISTGENNTASGGNGEDTQPAVKAHRSCSQHDNPTCDACNWATVSRPTKKRKRARVCKNSEEVESQRMTHIAVERNRRKQMNEHLNVLRSLMPATYIQRGDQASIIGGAIDFVKELEHVLQALHLKKQCGGCEVNRSLPNHDSAMVLESLMLKPHCVQPSTKCSYIETPRDIFAHLTCQGVDVEVNLIGSRALVKVLAQKLPHQLLNVASSFEILHFKILHLNITTIEQSVLYAFNLEMQCESQTLIANDIAKSIHNVFKP